MSHTQTYQKPFSLLLFTLQVGITSAGVYALYALLVPEFTASQYHSLGALCVTVLAVHLVASFVEFFFHRYVLHAPLIPLLSHFWLRHELHHRLTSVAGVPVSDNENKSLRVHNRFPIEREVQHEASFFPWYSLAGFMAFATPLLLLAQWVIPAAPVVLGGYIAVVISFIMYELIHAVEHMSPDTTLRPLFGSARWGDFWMSVYSFHLRHHANTLSNESISGFFGIPVPDLLFGTFVLPRTLYKNGEVVLENEFLSPKPRSFIQWLDTRADEARIFCAGLTA